MTRHYLDHWLDGANHYRMQLLGDAADNPDQRIAEDINQFVEKGTVPRHRPAQLAGHARLVRRHPVGAVGERAAHLFGIDWAIPGLSGLGGADLFHRRHGAHALDRPPAGAAQLPAAALRSRLPLQPRARARELRADRAARRASPRKSSACWSGSVSVVGNWLLIMSRTKRLTFFTAGYSQISTVFPFVVVSPAYFAGSIQLGGLMQTASAFNSVQSALSFFVSSTIYRQLAEWRAVIDRLAGFERAVDAGRSAAITPPVDRGRSRTAATPIELAEVEVTPAAGAPLVEVDELALAPGDQRAGDRAVRLGQVDAVPRHRRHLAVRLGLGRGAQGRTADDAAAAAVFPGRHAGRRRDLSGGARRLQPRADRRGARRRSACRRSRNGSTRRRTGTGCCRSASSSGSASRAPCCRHRTSCSSTRRPPRSTSRRKRRSTGCCRSGCPGPPSCRSATARRWRRSTTAAARSNPSRQASGAGGGVARIS